MSHITISKLVAALLVVSAILAPTAGARYFDEPGTDGQAAHTGTYASIPPASEPGPSATSAASSGFDWGDAAVGAASMLIVLGGGAAGVVTIRRNRERSQTLVTS